MKRQRRDGFTLVELLVVIAIIGVVVGIAIPGIMMAYIRVQRAAIKFEVDAISDAVEKYREKYQDYPPDGSNWTLFERHLRKAFPQILQSEIDYLNPANYAVPPAGFPVIRNDYYSAVDARVMSPAEALVFFLGGFSDNKERPFTGDGGPFVITPLSGGGTILQYNPSRKNSFYDFQADRLSIDVITVSSTLITVSVDEDQTHWKQQDNQATMAGVAYPANLIRDILPVYYAKYALKGYAPYVYFDARTFVSPKDGAVYFAEMRYAEPVDETKVDCARPYLSDQVDTTPGAGGFKYMNAETFQILAPGLDGKFGGQYEPLAASGGVPVLFRFPSGSSAHPTLGPTNRFNMPNPPFVRGLELTRSFQLDNCGDFSEVILENGLN